MESTHPNAHYLLRCAVDAGMVEPRELAVFMAQMQVESGGFFRLSENLNYSGKRLLQVFRGRNGIDTLAEADALAERGPEAVANAMYGGEWGKRLGNTEPDDGWRFRGRGFVQITGRSNYEHFGRALGIDLVSDPDLAETPDVAAAIAVQYWRERVARHGSQRDVRRATEAINGGHQGISERESAALQWELRLESELPEFLAGHSQPPSNKSQAEIQTEHMAVGMHGPVVRKLQSDLDRLGYRDANGHRLHPDGDFGRRTEEAVKAFQHAHGLEAVGYIGPKTHAALEAARCSGPTPVDPAHPDHALQQQVSRAVDAMEHALGRTPDAGSQRLKASLLVAAREHGLTQVDRVVLSEARGGVQAGQNVFAVQGRLDDPASRRVHVATQHALATPVDASYARLATQEATVRMQPSPATAHAMAATHGEYGAGLRRSPSP